MFFFEIQILWHVGILAKIWQKQVMISLFMILGDFCLIWKKRKKEIQLFDFILKGKNTFASGEAGKDLTSLWKKLFLD